MRQILVLVILFLAFKITYSQAQIGLKHDINGMPLNGYYDPINYFPKKKLSMVHYSDSYETGFYCDTAGEKVHGLIKFESDKIFFKKQGKDYPTKIYPEEIKYFIIGVDSFFVVSDFYFKNRIKDKMEFVQYITEFDGNMYVKHYHFPSGFSQQYGMKPALIETFLVKSEDSLIWDNFPDNRKFEERALKYFSHIPYLKEKISSRAYRSKDMFSIIKMAEYLQKYEDSKPIFYDRFWQETRDKKKVVYMANITQLKDSIWTFDYFEGTTKLYSVNYSSFYPHVKNGEFIAYYPNGKIRQLVTYKNDISGEYSYFTEDGVLKSQYQYSEREDDVSYKIYIDINYQVVNDSLGNNVIKKEGISFNSEYDEYSRSLYKSVYNNNQLISLYRVVGKDTIFQITDPEYDFKLKKLQKKFDKFMETQMYDEALSVNAQGIILYHLLIDEKGQVIESKALNELHPEFDKLAGFFIDTRLSKEGKKSIKLSPYKKHKEKRYCEVVLPIKFKIKRFYRQPASNYFQMNNMMMNNNFGTSPGSFGF